MSNTLAGDTDELEALFDSIVAANKPAPTPVTRIPVAPMKVSAKVSADKATRSAIKEPYYAQIGHLTRKLHGTLHALGDDQSLENVLDQSIPDTRNAINLAMSSQAGIENNSAKLSAQWDRLFQNELSIEDFKQLATDTRDFLTSASQQAQNTHQQLLKIMHAQDNQDSAGQGIKEIIAITQETKNQLLGLLLQGTPPGKKVAVNTSGHDSVTDPAQVDDLLLHLGF